MPIYEYLCEACGALTEQMQKVSEPGPRKCPECGSRKIARMISRTSFQLKGGGWYADLYSSQRSDADKKGTHAGKAAAAQGEAAQGEAAPAATAAQAAPKAEAKAPAAPKKGKKGR